LQKIFDFEQVEGEKLPESWARFCSLIRARPGNPLAKNELLDKFYNVNRNFGFHFVQFREYFLCNFSETQKQQKTGTDTVVSR
jgi:hypothetical protein